MNFCLKCLSHEGQCSKGSQMGGGLSSRDHRMTRIFVQRRREVDRITVVKSELQELVVLLLSVDNGASSHMIGMRDVYLSF